MLVNQKYKLRFYNVSLPVFMGFHLCRRTDYLIVVHWKNKLEETYPLSENLESLASLPCDEILQSTGIVMPHIITINQVNYMYIFIFFGL